MIDKISLDTPLTLPKSIGIDEFHGNTGHYDKSSKKLYNINILCCFNRSILLSSLYSNEMH